MFGVVCHERQARRQRVGGRSRIEFERVAFVVSEAEVAG
jgi:hypothetical protein